MCAKWLQNIELSARKKANANFWKTFVLDKNQEHLKTQWEKSKHLNPYQKFTLYWIFVDIPADFNLSFGMRRFQ